MGKCIFLAYRIAIFVLVPVIYVRYFLLGSQRFVYRERISERFGFLPENLAQGAIWIHAVSVGEVNAAVPLVRSLLEKQHRPVMMTCVTPTGSAQIKKTFGSDVEHVYAPVDAGVIVRRFLMKLKPSAVVIMETELWPNLIQLSTSKNIPVMFANLRMSDSTFRNASKLKLLCQFILKNVSAFCVQTEVDRERITALGATSTRVHVTGNLKFDVKAPQGILDTGKTLREFWGGQNVETIIFGSSHDGEETQFLEVFGKLRQEFPKLVCIVVPRHPERFDSVFETISQCGYSVVRRSEWDSGPPASIDVVLVDTMGELIDFYAASDIAVVGGSFVPVGGHNILEPILAQTPPVFGSQMSNFREISQLVLSAEAGCQIQDANELNHTIAQLLKNREQCETMVRNGQKLLSDNQGAVHKTWKILTMAV